MSAPAAPVIGGSYTGVVPYFPPPVTLAGDARGGTAVSGWAGSGVSVAVDGPYSDNGSTPWTAPAYASPERAQGRKYDYWGAPQFPHDASFATSSPVVGEEYLFAQDAVPVSSPFAVDFSAYYDNTGVSPGESGPEQTAVRNSGSWLVSSLQPRPDGGARQGSVKTYPANQTQFSDPGVPVSEFSKIWGYSNKASPPGNSSVIYEAAWDIYGAAHTEHGGTSLELMFWTYNHGQDRFVGPVVDTGVDLSGDGLLWDLTMTDDTLLTGGVGGQYSYGIWYLQDQFQADEVAVDILAGLRYFSKYFVVPSGPGSAASGLGVPVFQITCGWETCATDGTPLPFWMRDFKLVIE